MDQDIGPQPLSDENCLSFMETLKLEKEKSDLICKKLDAEEKKKQAANHFSKLNSEQDNYKDELLKGAQSCREMLQEKHQKYIKLKDQLVELENDLQRKQAVCDTLCTKFRIKLKLPEKNIKFIKSEQSVPVDQEGDEFLNIKCIYTILPKMSVVLQNGQALITFEEEQVASRILKITKHQIELQSEKIQVKAQSIPLDTMQQFEIHLNISMKEIKVSEIPNHHPEQMRDKLEISFSKPSLGGGEVENIEYSASSGTAIIKFVEKRVAQRIAEQKEYPLVINGTRTCWLTVEPKMESNLEKFQIFNGVSKRSVLLSDIKSTMEEEEMQDKLKIHFQKPSKQGGEVEDIKYVAKDKHLLVYFEEDSAKK
ncbi:N-myc-interactor isoform X2 [Rhinoraja longicauda]